MSKTVPREVIAEQLRRTGTAEEAGKGDDANFGFADETIEALDAAGFVIVPRVLVLQAAGQLLGHGPCADDISEQLALAAQEPKP